MGRWRGGGGAVAAPCRLVRCSDTAKRQGAKAVKYFKDAMAQPEKFRHLILAYKVKCLAGGRGRSRGEFDFVQYQEIAECSSGIRAEWEIVPMTVKGFSDWYQSDEGGNSTAEQAAEEWQRMLCDESIIKVNLRGALRCYVHKSDKIVGHHGLQNKQQAGTGAAGTPGTGAAGTSGPSRPGPRIRPRFSPVLPRSRLAYCAPPGRRL